MFRDLVTNYSLGRADHSLLTFYAKRLGKDQMSRGIAALMVVAVTVFQALTFIAPPAVSEASGGSSNDVIYGGFTSKADLLKKYDSNAELQGLYTMMRITRAQIAGSTPGKAYSDDITWSVGRNLHGQPGQNMKFTVPGGHSNFYLRPLSVWGKGKYFPGLHGINDEGNEFWILNDCGNPTVRLVNHTNPADKVPPPTPTTPPPPPPPPTPTPTPPPTPTPTPTPSPTLTPTPSPTRTPTPTPTPTPSPQAVYSCDQLLAYPDSKNPSHNEPLKVTFDVKKTVKNTAFISYLFDFGDSETKETTLMPVEHTFAKAGTYLTRVRIKTAAGTTDYKNICSQTTEVVSPSLSYLKSAVNLTQKDSQGQPTDANGKFANPGDQIKYSLTVKNSGTGISEKFKFEEAINDILEYATIKDHGGATQVDVIIPGQLAGATQKTLVWPAIDVKAGQSITKNFTIQIKNPIPTTAIGKSDKNSYDLVVENIFHDNRVVINVTPPPVKQIEAVSTTMPQTGSGIANFSLALFSSGAVFFYLRRRLVRKELTILASHPGGAL